MVRRNRSPRSKRLLFEALETRTTPSASIWGDGDLECLPAQGGPHQLDAGGKASAAKPVAGYSYAITGNAGDVSPTPISGLALMGGSTDVDAAFNWLGSQANGGDFLVLQASGTNYYNGYISNRASLDSVATLTIPGFLTSTEYASVKSEIEKAEGIFIAGGDQANYIKYWKGTAIEVALNFALSRGVPIGGTSAGLAVLGEVDFSAVNGSITSGEALANPYDTRITLDTGFITPNEVTAGTALQWLDNVITDSHFQQRNRMGRTLTFLARMDANDLVTSSPRGIAINEQTALLVGATGHADVVGNPAGRKDLPRSVFFLEGATVVSGTLSTPLNNYSARVQRVGVGGSFELSTWQYDASSYLVTAISGNLSSSNGSIY